MVLPIWRTACCKVTESNPIQCCGIDQLPSPWKTNLLETVWCSWRISISLLCHHTDPLPENISRIIILFSLRCCRLTLQEMSVHTCFPISATCSNTCIQLSCCCRGLGCKYYTGLLCTCFFNHIFVIPRLQKFVLSYLQQRYLNNMYCLRMLALRCGGITQISTLKSTLSFLPILTIYQFQSPLNFPWFLQTISFLYR